MEAATCLKCGNRVHGQMKDIILTLYCEQCFNKQLYSDAFASREIYWTWTSTPDIPNSNGINPNALAALRFKAVRRSSTSLRPFSRQYLMAEVEALRSLSAERLQIEILERRAERQEKRMALMGATGIRLHELNAYLQLLLLGEYLSGACMRPSELNRIVERCRVAPRVNAILQWCKGAHPEAAIDFCLQYPTAGPREFQELKEKMRLVFHHQGFRIMGMMFYDIRRLNETPLYDVCQQFLKRRRIGCIRSYLVPIVGLMEAENIVKHPVCKEWLKQTSPRDANDRFILKQVLKFWNERGSPMEKKHRLIHALASRGAPYPSDAWIRKLCDDYINGTKFILLEEIMQHVINSWMCQVKNDYKNGIWKRS